MKQASTVAQVGIGDHTPPGGKSGITTRKNSHVDDNFETAMLPNIKEALDKDDEYDKLQ